MYQLNIKQQQLTLEGITYSQGELLCFLKDQPRYAELYAFLLQWFDNDAQIKVHTSGSTGKPKELIVRKEQMMQSARLTADFLKLKQGDKALLCMSINYIAGKMMVVRALVAGLDLYLVPSCGHPFANISQTFRFVAMVPLQVYNTLQIPVEKARLKQTDILIIGGGAIDATLSQELATFPNSVYSTYGMTETLSHIALRKLNGSDASAHYIPFSSVKLSLSTEQTLTIDAPLVCDDHLQTNDIATIHPDGSFTIIGRRDNTINSGGVKIQIEEVEEKLKSLIDVPFAITSQPHPKFGEIVVLLIEHCSNSDLLALEMAIILSPYQQPKHVFVVKAIPLTQSGKINRAATRQLALDLLPASSSK